MVEQWYAVHKETGEVFCHNNRYCFTEKGLKSSIRNSYGTWVYKNKSSPYDLRMVLIDKPEENWVIKRIELT